MSKPTPYTIATVVTQKALDAILENAAEGTYRDTHPWVVARELWAEANADGLALPVLFAKVDEGQKEPAFSHWAWIEDIDVLEYHKGSWDTRCRFSKLNAVNPIWESLDSVVLYPAAELRHREAVEPVKIHRQILDEHLLHPYAIIETPPFIGIAPEGDET